MDAYLREHYPDGTVLDIADALGMSPPPVSRRVKELGLQHSEGWSQAKFNSRYVKNYAGYRNGLNRLNRMDSLNRL